ncbi:CAZyme family GH3 [Trichoderma harzianum]|nr:CAZyme family GH3 [Trichoderma harzianum]
MRSASDMDEQVLLRVLGNLFLLAFDGTVLSKELQKLIEGHYVGAILLTSKNLESAEQAMHLITSLQYCAYRAGYERPLLVAIDQENGSLNSLVDKSITQFPSAMGMAAAASPGLTRKVAMATASELSCIGINWIIGPVLDILSASRPSPLGVRSFGDDPITVLAHGLETVRGFKNAGVACCGKHFPSYGDVKFADGTELSMPSMDATMEDLQNRAVIPFRVCGQVGLSAILVGGYSLRIAGKTISYACLEKSVVHGILREQCHFDGVVVSECLTMESLCEDIGISQASHQAQLEGIAALKLAVQDGVIPLHVVQASNNRINAMKDGCTSWERALCPQGPTRLADLNMEHLALSGEAYRGAISLVRDAVDGLVCIRNLPDDKEVLLLTPLLEPFPSTATRKTIQETATTFRQFQLAPGEDTFQLFGTILAEHLKVRLTHTSYSSNGLRPLHEELISRSSAVIIMTADATRNTYQYGVTKHVNMQCRYQPDEDGRARPLVVVALSSPYDFLTDKDINTYICTYDFTTPSLKNLALLLAGKLDSTNKLPLAAVQPAKLDTLERQTNAAWLVESYDGTRDWLGLEKFMRLISTTPESLDFLSPAGLANDEGSKRKCFVVRNSSTGTILGLLVTLIFQSQSDGQIETVLVDPNRKGVGIETSLREHALRYLASIRGFPGAGIEST